MTRLELRNLIRKNLGETTAAFWTDAELNVYIDNAGRDVAKLSKCITGNQKFSTVLDQEEYVLTAVLTDDPVWIDYVYLNQGGTQWVKLDKTTKEELDETQDGWLSADSSTPYKFWYDIEEDLIYLYPGPDATETGTDRVRVWYAKKFTPITGDTAPPVGIPDELQLAMADFVTAFGYQQRGWGEKSNDAWAKYYQRIKDFLATRNDPDIVMKSYRNL